MARGCDADLEVAPAASRSAPCRMRIVFLFCFFCARVICRRSHQPRPLSCLRPPITATVRLPARLLPACLPVRPPAAPFTTLSPAALPLPLSQQPAPAALRASALPCPSSRALFARAERFFPRSTSLSLLRPLPRGYLFRFQLLLLFCLVKHETCTNTREIFQKHFLSVDCLKFRFV